MPATPSAAHVDRADIAFVIGWDHAERGCVPPPEHLHPASPVRQGWQAGLETFGRRTLPAGVHVRRWLQARLDAWRAGIGFEADTVNPSLLRRIDAVRCPVTREPIRADGAGPDAAALVRLDERAPFSAGHLAVTSLRAAEARRGLGVDDMLARAQSIFDGHASRIAGLDTHAWSRLALLVSFVTPLPHTRAACLPLVALPPARVRLVNPVQALQVMLSVQFTRAGHARRCATIGALMPDAETRHAFHALMHTLLARRLAAGRHTDPAAERHAVEDLWRDALVQRRWLRLALRLTEADCERVCRIAVERGLGGPALRRAIPDAQDDALDAAPQAPTGAGHPPDEAVAARDRSQTPVTQARYAARLTPAATAPIRRFVQAAGRNAEPG